jgi:hypothetical protein
MKYWLHINIFSSLGAGFPFKSLKNTRPHRIKTQKMVLLELRKNGTFLFANYISIKKYKKSALLELEIEGHREYIICMSPCKGKRQLSGCQNYSVCDKVLL